MVGGGLFSILWRADDVTRTMSKGGGACECPTVGGVFQLSGGRVTSRGQCPKGGACECKILGKSTPPPN